MSATKSIIEQADEIVGISGMTTGRIATQGFNFSPDTYRRGAYVEFGHHGAKDRAEGCVLRVERDGSVDYLAKYVRADKVDGKYFAETHGRDVWNTWKGWNP